MKSGCILMFISSIVYLASTRGSGYGGFELMMAFICGAVFFVGLYMSFKPFIYFVFGKRCWLYVTHVFSVEKYMDDNDRRRYYHEVYAAGYHICGYDVSRLDKSVHIWDSSIPQEGCVGKWLKAYKMGGSYYVEDRKWKDEPDGVPEAVINKIRSGTV